jgi:hypothetical protein
MTSDCYYLQPCPLMAISLVNMRHRGKYLFHVWLTVSSFVTVVITCVPSTASFNFVQPVTRFYSSRVSLSGLYRNSCNEDGNVLSFNLL